MLNLHYLLLLILLIAGGSILRASSQPIGGSLSEVGKARGMSISHIFASWVVDSVPPGDQRTTDSGDLRFAVIGDYGSGDQNEADVAALVTSWNPDVIVTTGDNNYPDGEAETIDENIGQFFHQYINPYLGTYGSSEAPNRFFPSLGNHDLRADDGQPYLDYFTLPGNERYYDFVSGPVHFFVLNSELGADPDGHSADSIQGNWLKMQLTSSTSAWRIVYMHHPPYSSGSHGSSDWMQWPFADWGADAILSGHDHTYERISRGGITYFVNGLGGKSIYECGKGIEGSQICYDDEYGAMLVEAGIEHIIFKFINVEDEVVDEFEILQHFHWMYLPVVQ